MTFSRRVALVTTAAIGVTYGTAATSRQAADPVARLGWMAGSWHGAAHGLSMEEHWTAPRAGSMLGMHRDVKGGATAGFEFARIESRDGTPVYLASPGGAPPTPFPAVEVAATRVVFENLAHDFPQRVIYWREGAALHARIEGRQDGRLATEEWTWHPGSLHGPKP